MKARWAIVKAALVVIYRVAREYVTVSQRGGEWLVCVRVPKLPWKPRNRPPKGA